MSQINEPRGAETPAWRLPRTGILAGQWRWRWDLNPRKTWAFTRFRVLRNAVHHRPPTFMSSPNRRPAATGERPRTEVNEPKTEPKHLRGTNPDGGLRAAAMNAEEIS